MYKLFIILLLLRYEMRVRAFQTFGHHPPRPINARHSFQKRRARIIRQIVLNTPMGDTEVILLNSAAE